MRRMPATCASAVEIIVELWAIIRVRTVVDDDTGPLTRGEAAQIGKALFRYQNVHVMLRMVDMRDHRNDGRYRAVLGFGFGHEDRDEGVTGKVA